MRNEFLNGDADEMHVYGFFLSVAVAMAMEEPHAKARLGS